MSQPVETRKAPKQEIDVSFRKRTIEMIVMPYEQEAVVDYKGRLIREVVSRGACDGIERRPNRVILNRGHNLDRICGRAITFHPSRLEGLVAECKVSKTPLGDETLELANDGLLDASAGFTPMLDKATGKVAEGAEEWRGRDYRRLNTVWLHHIAMTPDPAYEGARVLAVRQNVNQDATEASTQQPETPNLNLVRTWRLQEEFERLSPRV